MRAGWEIKKLNEVLKIQNGYAFDSKLFTSDRDGMPLIRIRDIKDGIGTVINYKGKFDNKYEVKAGDFLIGMDGEFGCYEWKGEAALLNQRVCKLQEFNTNLNARFLFYGINKYLKAIEDVTAFTTVKHISSKQIENIEFPIPPLPEQQRIVAILDETFAVIDKAKANTEKNLKNSKELFESYLQGVFTKKNWEEEELGNLCHLITKGSSPKWQGIKYVDKPGVLFVTSENVGQGKMLLTVRKYVEEKFNLKDKKSILKRGDVLTNIVGASIGRTAIYDVDDIANINQAVCILRCNPNLILNNYLMNLLNSPFLRKILHENEVNTARANLSLGFFNKLSIPYPTIEEQQTIVRQLDAIQAETKRLESIFQQKLTDLEELKKSILQKAFNGELNTAEICV